MKTLSRNQKLAAAGVAALTLVTSATLAQDHKIQAVIGNVFLQNTTPGTAQVGHATITGTFRAGQMFVQQGSTATIPVVGNSLAATGTTFGGSFSNAAPNGAGVRGTATSTSGSTIGVRGITRSGNGIGVQGISDAVNGTGVQGEANDGPGVVGFSQSGVGVRAVSNTGCALEATCGGPNFSTIFGQNIAVTGTNNIGVDGRSARGTGVYGEVTATSGITTGVLGETHSAAGFGVFSRGDIGATGTKSFVIDHPSDPENRYLRHYCAEGPEPRNVYMGRVTTGPDGFATVRLPGYYSAINCDPEYTLTVVNKGAGFALAMVTREIEGNSFQIQTSKPGVTISWRVDAVRNDRAVKRNGFSAESDKPAESRGTYLQPELYGQPQSKGQWRPRPLQEHAPLP